MNKQYRPLPVGEAQKPFSTFSFLVGCLLLSLIFCNTSVYAGPREFPAPDWMQKVQVAKQMIINGVPSVVQYFEAHRETDDLLNFYRKRWKNGNQGKPGYREATFPPWSIVSRLDGNYLYTVQVQESGAFSINGYLAIADLKQMAKQKKESIPVPQMNGSRIVNDVTSFDPGIKGRTLMLTNKYSTVSNSQYYRNYYLERGWGKLMDADSDGTNVMAFRKRSKEAHLVISSLRGSTQVVMNLTEKN